MKPRARLVAEVCALAKSDLAVGQTLDAIGETCYRSWTMTVDDAAKERGIPVGLLEGGRVRQPIAKGDLITFDNVEPDRSTKLYQMRQLQDAQ
jgi:predicted homoserine dehydrogenase-like protein